MEQVACTMEHIIIAIRSCYPTHLHLSSSKVIKGNTRSTSVGSYAPSLYVLLVILKHYFTYCTVLSSMCAMNVQYMIHMSMPSCNHFENSSYIRVLASRYVLLRSRVLWVN